MTAASDDLVVAHQWIDAGPPTDPPAPAFVESLGRSLAVLHSLDVPSDPLDDDVLARRPPANRWADLGREAEARGLEWGRGLLDAAEELAAANDLLDHWDDASRADLVFSHRDLTLPNTLDDRGDAVLIDWESAGPVRTSAELGRTALDHLHRDGTLDRTQLITFLRAYAERAPLPPVAEDWLTLWIRGLVVFAEQCAASCLDATGPPAQLEFQATVVAATPAELRRRLRLADEILHAFDASVRA